VAPFLSALASPSGFRHGRFAAKASEMSKSINQTVYYYRRITYK
jgi:hypothetical protein